MICTDRCSDRNSDRIVYAVISCTLRRLLHVVFSIAPREGQKWLNDSLGQLAKDRVNVCPVADVWLLHLAATRRAQLPLATALLFRCTFYLSSFFYLFPSPRFPHPLHVSRPVSLFSPSLVHMDARSLSRSLCIFSSPYSCSLLFSPHPRFAFPCTFLFLPCLPSPLSLLFPRPFLTSLSHLFPSSLSRVSSLSFLRPQKDK